LARRCERAALSQHAGRGRGVGERLKLPNVGTWPSPRRRGLFHVARGWDQIVGPAFFLVSNLYRARIEVDFAVFSFV
jgi:hypothetical protein